MLTTITITITRRPQIFSVAPSVACDEWFETVCRSHSTPCHNRCSTSLTAFRLQNDEDDEDEEAEQAEEPEFRGGPVRVHNHQDGSERTDQERWR